MEADEYPTPGADGNPAAAGSIATTNPVRRLLLEHSALLAPVVVVLLTTIRLLSVSHGDPTTALAILQHAGTADVLVGLVVDLLPALLALVLVAALATLPPDARVRQVPWPVWLGAGATAVLTPVGILLAFLLVAPTVSAVVVFLSRRFGWNLDRVTPASLPFRIVLATAAVLTAFSDRPWVPAERIVTDTGGRTAYVLESSAEELVVLTLGGEVSIVLKPVLKSRTICIPRRQVPRVLAATPLGLLAGEGDVPAYPRCRDLRAADDAERPPRSN